jgi:chromosomal replication initiation ATPase DnaA
MSPRVRSILQAVADEHGVSVGQLEAIDRRKAVSHARFDAMARIRALHRSNGEPCFSFPQIGALLGGLDHTTIIYGIRRAEQLFGPRSPTYPIIDCEETRL